MIDKLTDWLLFLHILAAIVWLGGLIMLRLLATLVLRSRDGDAVTRFVGSLRVIGPFALAPAMVALLGLGIWMVAHDEAGTSGRPGFCSRWPSSPERFASEPCSRAAPRSAPSTLPTPATTAKPRASCAVGHGAHDDPASARRRQLGHGLQARPMRTQLHFHSATDAAEMVRRKEVSSRELTELLLARIDALNPDVNAVVELRSEEALKDANAADRATADAVSGPLHGVPMTIKESFNVAGLHTTWGNPVFKDYVADADATVVRRLRQAGAIIVGKTNVHAMLADYGQTANEIYGVTNNPWDLTRTPGGSTGGGAAALAAGLTFLEYGSDLVGSIRIPASFCGVYGLKPSVGIVPLSGFQPPGPPAGPSEMAYMSAVGPLARSAPDLRVALTVTAGPEPPVSEAYSWRLPPPRHKSLEEFRVGVVLDHEQAPVSSEVTTPLSNAVDGIARAGATVVEGWPEDVDPVQVADSFGFHVGLFFAFQQPDEDFERVSEFVEQENRRMATRAAWSRYFTEIDVFLCPSNFTPAFPHDARPFDERTITTPEGERPYTNQPFWISHASLPGLPAVVAPIRRTPGGLPVGAQIVGPLYEDDTALSFAELLADAIGGYESPPI